VTTAEDIKYLEREMSLNDEWTVTFSLGPLFQRQTFMGERAGAQFVECHPVREDEDQAPQCRAFGARDPRLCL
jgi:hypothetical protein